MRVKMAVYLVRFLRHSFSTSAFLYLRVHEPIIPPIWIGVGFLVSSEQQLRPIRRNPGFIGAPILSSRRMAALEFAREAAT
jgi:hypothetical protein